MDQLIIRKNRFVLESSIRPMTSRGETMAANPGARRREREIETRILEFLLGSKMNLSSPVSRKKRKRKALDTSTTPFSLLHRLCDSSPIAA